MMQQTSLNIGTIGQKLEAARQAKGVSVSEAGRATKILSKFIEAMEADDFGVLSAPVYAKSFIKMYAQYLGLDARPLVDEYAEQHAPKVKRPLPDEVKVNLARADLAAGESATPSRPQGTASMFGGVNQIVEKLTASRITPKMLAIAGGCLLALLIIVLSATQCAEDKKDAPAAAGGAAMVERQLLFENAPDAYLVKPGEIEAGN